MTEVGFETVARMDARPGAPKDGFTAFCETDLRHRRSTA